MQSCAKSHPGYMHGGTAQRVRWFLKSSAGRGPVTHPPPPKALSSVWSPARKDGGCLASVRPLSFVLKAGTERPAVSRWFGWWVQSQT